MLSLPLYPPGQRAYTPRLMGAAVAGEPWLSGSIERWWRVGERCEGPPARPRLLDQVRAALRLRHYSRRTERAYVGWMLLGHRDVARTTIYTHVLNRGPGAMHSPLDGLAAKGATTEPPRLSGAALPSYIAATSSLTRRERTPRR